MELKEENDKLTQIKKEIASKSSFLGVSLDECRELEDQEKYMKKQMEQYSSQLKKVGWYQR